MRWSSRKLFICKDAAGENDKISLYLRGCSNEPYTRVLHLKNELDRFFIKFLISSRISPTTQIIFLDKVNNHTCADLILIGYSMFTASEEGCKGRRFMRKRLDNMLKDLYYGCSIRSICQNPTRKINMYLHIVPRAYKQRVGTFSIALYAVTFHVFSEQRRQIFVEHYIQKMNNFHLFRRCAYHHYKILYSQCEKSVLEMRYIFN